MKKTNGRFGKVGSTAGTRVIPRSYIVPSKMQRHASNYSSGEKNKINILRDDGASNIAEHACGMFIIVGLLKSKPNVCKLMTGVCAFVKIASVLETKAAKFTAP